MSSIGSPIQIIVTKYLIKTKTLGYIVIFKEVNVDYWGNNWTIGAAIL